MINFILIFFFNDTAPTEIYTSVHTLSLHDALPIFVGSVVGTWMVLSGPPATHGLNGRVPRVSLAYRRPHASWITRASGVVRQPGAALARGGCPKIATNARAAPVRSPRMADGARRSIRSCQPTWSQPWSATSWPSSAI